jgi:hypothetical protein
MRLNRSRQLLKFLAVAALALGIFAAPGRAGDSLTGSFTLPFEAHWGKAVLSAGHYTFDVLPSNNVGQTLRVDGNGKSYLVYTGLTDSGTASGETRLDFVEVAGEQYVRSLELPGLNETLVYPVPKSKPEQFAKK